MKQALFILAIALIGGVLAVFIGWFWQGFRSMT